MIFLFEVNRNEPDFDHVMSAVALVRRQAPKFRILPLLFILTTPPPPPTSPPSATLRASKINLASWPASIEACYRNRIGCPICRVPWPDTGSCRKGRRIRSRQANILDRRPSALTEAEKRQTRNV